MRTSLICVLVLLISSPLSTPLAGPAVAQDRPNHAVELIEGRFDGTYLAALTVDRVTDKFGRPSSVENGIKGITGPTLKYHPVGMEFSFDPIGRLYIVVVYLSQTWDAKSAKHFEPFAGSLSPEVSANMKGEGIMANFSSYSPVYKSSEQRRRELEAAKIPVRTQNLDDVISIQLPGHTVNFILEKNTKFLERISVISK